MSTTPTLADAVCRVRGLLDRIGDALAAGHGDPLLAAEADLGRAVETLLQLSRGRGIPPGPPRELDAEVARCRAALARCRRLGASLDDFVTQTLSAGGRSGAYTRAGQAAVLPPAGTLQARG